jgi:hypothetical protein
LCYDAAIAQLHSSDDQEISLLLFLAVEQKEKGVCRPGGEGKVGMNPRRMIGKKEGRKKEMKEMKKKTKRIFCRKDRQGFELLGVLPQ